MRSIVPVDRPHVKQRTYATCPEQHFCDGARDDWRHPGTAQPVSAFPFDEEGLKWNQLAWILEGSKGGRDMSVNTLPTIAPTLGETSWFIHDRFGLFVHWGLYALPARHEWVRNRERIKNEDYQKYFDHFDPDLYDPQRWACMPSKRG